MRLSGYRVPGEPERNAADTVGAALFAGLTEDERDELPADFASCRTRRRPSRGAIGPS